MDKRFIEHMPKVGFYSQSHPKINMSRFCNCRMGQPWPAFQKMIEYTHEQNFSITFQRKNFFIKKMRKNVLKPIRKSDLSSLQAKIDSSTFTSHDPLHEYSSEEEIQFGGEHDRLDKSDLE